MPADKQYPNVSFRPGDELYSSISQRSGEYPHQTVKRDLKRYYDALEANLPKFSQNEALLLCDALNGVMAVPTTLWQNVAYACYEEHLGAKWQVDQDALLDRIHNLSYIESLAVIDAVERAWGNGVDVNLSQKVLLVGLVNQLKSAQQA